MVDKEIIIQVLCSLMQKPSYLSETDKYYLTPDDFSTIFEKYIFSAIFNLYKSGAEHITVVDIDVYFNDHAAAKAVFEKEKGIEFLQNGLDFVLPENFPFYYKKLKKFNCLRDLKKIGFDTSNLYSDNLLDDNSKKINERFEELEISDIFDIVKRKFLKVETDYKKGDASEITKANKGLVNLKQKLKQHPEVGSPLQGMIFNTVCRGARKGKFYLRTASSGTGKTRAAVGDACYLSYPLRFNQTSWKWELCGSNEKTLFIATEQELEEVQTLILAYLTGLNEEKILNGQYSDEEDLVLSQAIEIMDTFSDNLLIVQLPNPNIEQIKATVRQSWIVNDIQNVFYDYIFSSPSLLNEFRDLRIREDVALGMMSTALKDLAVEMKLFVMSSTQTNAKSEEAKGVKNESILRGARAIADKIDLGAIISRVTDEEVEVLRDVIENIGIIPNQVMDIYKNRRGRFVNIRIWSFVDLGTCRKKDLFMTDGKFQSIDNFSVVDYVFNTENKAVVSLIKKLNEDFVQEEQLPEVHSSFEGLL